MSGGVSGPFIRHPVATTLSMVAILLAGAVAYPLLPVAPLPQIDFPTISGQRRPCPARQPDTMASAVAQPLERQFAQIPGVTQMTSTSSLGAAAITVQFDLNRDIDAAANDIQAAINAAGGQLPKILPSPPTYRKVNPVGYADSHPVGRRRMRRRSPSRRRRRKHSRQQISQISGVSLVRVGGQQQPAIRIQIDPAKLVEKNLRSKTCGAQIGSRPSTAQKARSTARGSLHDLRQRPIDQSERMERRHYRLPQWRSGAHPRRRAGNSRAGGRDAGGLGQWQARRVPCHIQHARRERHRDRRRVKADDDASASGDPGVDARHGAVATEPQTIRAAVQGRAIHPDADDFAGRDGHFRLSQSFWATVIPEHHGAAGAAGGVRPDVGGRYSLDNLSLMALTIAVGFVVDDAIVVLENITRYVEQGMKPHQAALQGRGRNRLHRSVDLASPWSPC